MTARTDNGQWTTDNGQRTTDNGQRTTDNGQRTTDNGQRTTDNGQRTTDNRLGADMQTPLHGFAYLGKTTSNVEPSFINLISKKQNKV